MLSKSPYHQEISKSDGMQGLWWSSISNYFFEIVVVPFAIQRQSSSIARRDKHSRLLPLSKDSMSVDQSYWSLPYYPETSKFDSMWRPSQLSIFINFKAPRVLMMCLLSFMLFLLTSFTDWASGRPGGNLSRTKLVYYLYFLFISNKR